MNDVQVENKRRLCGFRLLIGTVCKIMDLVIALSGRCIWERNLNCKNKTKTKLYSSSL